MAQHINQLLMDFSAPAIEPVAETKEIIISPKLKQLINPKAKRKRKKGKKDYSIKGYRNREQKANAQHTREWHTYGGATFSNINPRSQF